MNSALTPQDLQIFLNTHGITEKILLLDVPTPTVETAAQAVAAHPNQIVKSVLFLIDVNPILAIAYGTSHIDQRNIAKKYEIGRKRVKLADAETVLRYTGYSAG